MPPKQSEKGPSLYSLLRPYTGLIALLVVLTIAANGLNLAVPQIIAQRHRHLCGRAFRALAPHHRVLARRASSFSFSRTRRTSSRSMPPSASRATCATTSPRRFPSSPTSISTASPRAKLLTNLTSRHRCGQVLRLPGDRRAHLLRLPHHRRVRTPAPARLAPRARRAHRRSYHRGTFYYVLGRVRKLFTALAGSYRLAQLRHQRKHPRLLAHPAAELAAVRVPEIPRRQHGGHEIGMSILRTLLEPHPGHHALHQSRDAHHPRSRRALRHQRLDDARRLHRLQQLPRHPHLPDTHHRLYEQCHRAGDRLLWAHQRWCSHAPDEKKTGGFRRSFSGDIEVKNVTVRFGEKSALKDVSLYGGRGHARRPSSARRRQGRRSFCIF